MNPHVDPERLAAFMEGSISRSERAQIERHAADCPDCMQQLAMMARTADVATARAAALPRFLRWAVPAAVAATALAVWVNVDDGSRRGAAPSEAQRTAAQVEQKDAPAREIPLDRRASEAVPPAPDARESKGAPFKADPQARADGGAGANAAAVPPAVPAPPAELAGAAAADRDASASAAATAAAPPRRDPPSVEGPQPLAETVQAERRESLARGLADTAVPFEFRSPDAARRWRVRGRVLERSLDAGRTWQVQSPALTVDVLAGSAPAADIAWLVGRAGAVLRTTDGERWARLPFPDTADLTTIQAVSALEAAVTTADGRRFRTADGGLSWALQESPAPPF